jgi:hypothetical protein
LSRSFRYGKRKFSIDKQARKVFFFEEKKQKTFVFLATSSWAPAFHLAAGEGIKVFWFPQGGRRLF